LKLKLFFSSILFFFSSTLLAQDGLALLRIASGARQAGMGEATVAVSDNITGLSYNPALLSKLKKFTFSFGHTSYWEDVRQETGYAAGKLTDKIFFHSAIRFAVVDNIEQRIFPTPEPISVFDAHDISFKTGLAYKYNSRLTLGAAIGLITEKIETWQGTAFNIDFGFFYSYNKNLAIGASVVNLGKSFNLSKAGSVDSRVITLPTRYSTGVSLKNEVYNGMLDVVYLDDELKLHSGLEVKVHEMFMVRSGLMLNYDSKNFSAGMSFYKRNITVDYAYVPYSNDLGATHMFNFTFSL
jgi:hypothetical protein